MLLNCGVGEDSWESLGQQGDPTRQSLSKSILNIHWKDWYWSRHSNILATWCEEEKTHWKRPWCCERLKAGGEGDGRGWDSWMLSLTQWTWVWANSERWRRMGSLVWWGPWGHKELDTTEWLNNKDNSNDENIYPHFHWQELWTLVCLPTLLLGDSWL